MSRLVRYEAMVSAIAECHRVDEVKDIRDKALALELYAKQAKDESAIRRANEIRLRAERRAGELLKEMAHSGQRATPADTLKKGGSPVVARCDHGKSGQPKGPQSRPATLIPAKAKTLTELGISKTQSSRWQALAEVPAEVFEDALRDKPSPSTSAIINEAREPPFRVNEESLWLWGRARDFERRKFYQGHSISGLVDGMTEEMQADMVRLVPKLVALFKKIQEVISREHA